MQTARQNRRRSISASICLLMVVFLYAPLAGAAWSTYQSSCCTSGQCKFPPLHRTSLSSPSIVPSGRLARPFFSAFADHTRPRITVRVVHPFREKEFSCAEFCCYSLLLCRLPQRVLPRSSARCAASSTIR